MLERFFNPESADKYAVDHIVITANDPEKTVDFYVSVLGAKKEIFKGSRIALLFDHKKFNVHPFYGEPIYPRAANPTPGSLDICFRSNTPIEQLKSYFESLHIPIVEGPVERTGALGPMRSIYIRDPDGNLLEFANYPVKYNRLFGLIQSFNNFSTGYKFNIMAAAFLISGAATMKYSGNKLFGVLGVTGLLTGYGLWRTRQKTQDQPVPARPFKL